MNVLRKPAIYAEVFDETSGFDIDNVTYDWEIPDGAKKIIEHSPARLTRFGAAVNKALKLFGLPEMEVERG